jgi:hypothetical protein
MLDQLISFANEINARTVTVLLDKAKNVVLITADHVPGVVFSLPDLRTSKGGILNDSFAQKVLNRQLGATSSRVP